MAETELIVTKFTADLTELDKGVDDYAKTLGKATAADDKLEKSQKDLSASTGSLSAKFEATAKASKINADAVRKSREEAAKLIAANTSLNASQKQAAAAAGGITKEYNALTTSANKAATATRAVATETKKTGASSGLLGKLSSAFDNVKLRVGAVTKGSGDLFGSITNGLRTATPGIGGFGSLFSTIAGPIGLATAAVGAFIANFSRLDSVKIFFDAVKIGFDQVGQRLANLDFSSFLNPKTAAQDAVFATNVAQALDKIQEAQLGVNKANAEAELQITGLNQQLRDRTKTDEERLAIADQIAKIEAQRAKQEQDFLAVQVGLQKGINAGELERLGEVSDASKQALNEREIALLQSQERTVQLTETTERRVNAIVEQGASERATLAAKEQAELDKIAAARAKAAAEAARKAQVVATAEQQINDILIGVSRQREDLLLTDAQKEIEAVKRKYEDIAKKTKEGFDKIAAVTPAAKQGEVAARADDAQVKIKEAESAELIAIGQRTLEKLQQDQDAADAFLLQRKQSLNDAQLQALIEEQQKELGVTTAKGDELNAILERQAKERLTLQQASEEANLSALISEFEKEAAILDAKGIDTHDLIEQFEKEIEAMKDGFRKKNLTKEEEDAQKVLAIKRNARNAQLQLEADAFSLAQEFTDFAFDRKIAKIEEQSAILQEKLAAATTDAEKARIQAQIDGAAKQKTALEEQKKGQQTFAIAAAGINTFLAAQLAFSSQLVAGDPSSLFRAILAASLATAAGLLNVAKIKGFEVGGHTSRRANDRDPVGVVHANEWVAPAWQVKDPRYAETIKWLEEGRKRRRATSGLGFIGGGSVTGQSQCIAAGGTWVNGSCVMPQGIGPRQGRRDAIKFVKGSGINEVTAMDQCAISGGVWINGACVRPEDAPRAFIGEERVGSKDAPIWSGRDGFLRRVHKDEGIVDAKTNMEHLPAINSMRSGTFDDFVGTNYLMPIIEALNHRDDAKASGFVQTDMGQRMANSVMLAKFYDKNIVETGMATNKALRQQTELLAQLVSQGKPQSKRYY